MSKVNLLKMGMVERLKKSASELAAQIQDLESIRCGREEYKKNRRKAKVLKLRMNGALRAAARWEASIE